MAYVFGLSCDVVRVFGVPAGVLGVLEVTEWKVAGKNRYFLTVDDNTKKTHPEFLKYHPYEKYFLEQCLFTQKGLGEYHLAQITDKAASLEKHYQRRLKMPKYYSDVEAKNIAFFAEHWGVEIRQPA